MAIEFTWDNASLPSVPVPYADSYDGHEWRDKAEQFGWDVPGLWGRDGWDLGSWPLVVMALYDSEKTDTWALMTYVEGDMVVKVFTTREARDLAVTEVAVGWWRFGTADGPDDLPETGWLPHHHGPHVIGRE
ncbi:hypothetical protein ACFQ1S_03730 [Kibdelosporangium lantanae]|uniref:Uncharacterized protein n=1 Tax=Kibdelosporangium lantanae TaxID=1497396 RepID=A0ABW3M4B1_9PSEU